MSYCYQDPYHDDYSYEYADNGSYDNSNNEYNAHELYSEANHNYPKPNHPIEHSDKLNHAKLVHNNSDPPSEYNNYKGDNNRTGGDWQIGCEGEADRDGHRLENSETECETTEEVHPDHGEYKSTVFKYEHTGRDNGVYKPQQPWYNNNKMHELERLECVSDR